MARVVTGRIAAAVVLGLVAVAAAFLLGRWQYDGWQAQREAEARDLTKESPTPLTSVLGPDDAFPGDAVGRPVEIAGTWLPEASFAVSDRADEAARPGFWAVTPVAVDGTDAAILVVRGWTPEVADTEPDAAPSGSAALVAWLQPAEGSNAPDADLTDRVVPELRTAGATQLVDRDLFSGFAVAREAQGTGLTPVTPDQVPGVGVSTALRNLLYAIQWLIFGGFAVFLVQRFIRDELDAPVGSAP